MTITANTLRIGERYNWKNQPERLVYMGTRRYPGDGRTWHRFAKVETPKVCWSEVLDSDLASFEAAPAPARPQCAVGGMIRPGAMCGSVIVGGRLCGFPGDCPHKA